MREKSRSPLTLTADALWFFSALVGAAALVMFMFVLALIGTGDANTQGKVGLYAYLTGVGAAPWLVVALLAFGLAAWRSNQLNDKDAES